MQGGLRTHALAIGAALLAAVGCVHTHQTQMGPPDMGTLAAVPPSGAVPRELDKITLPPYVIEAPDQLLIEVVQRSLVKDPDTGLQAPGHRAPASAADLGAIPGSTRWYGRPGFLGQCPRGGLDDGPGRRCDP